MGGQQARVSHSHSYSTSGGGREQSRDHGRDQGLGPPKVIPGEAQHGAARRGPHGELFAGGGGGGGDGGGGAHRWPHPPVERARHEEEEEE